MRHKKSENKGDKKDNDTQISELRKRIKKAVREATITGSVHGAA